MKSSTKWLLLILILVLAYIGWRYFWPHDGSSEAHATAEDPGLLVDRVWVDSKPEKYTDFVHAALFIDYAPMGVFQKASAYRAELELFEYKRSGNKVKLRFPQTDKSRGFSYEISACDDLPPFDLCLRLSKNPWGGPRRYYGLRDPDQESSLLGAVRDRLDAGLESAGALRERP